MRTGTKSDRALNVAAGDVHRLRDEMRWPAVLESQAHVLCDTGSNRTIRPYTSKPLSKVVYSTFGVPVHFEKPWESGDGQDEKLGACVEIVRPFALFLC